MSLCILLGKVSDFSLDVQDLCKKRDAKLHLFLISLK